MSEHEHRAGAVTIAYVHDKDVSYSWHHSLIELVGWDIANHARIIRGGYVSINYGTDGLVDARNQAVREFLADDRADWLLWIDTDMGFPPDAADRLLEHADPVEHPIVGALCFSQRETDADGMGGWHTSATPTVFDWAHVGDQQGFAVRWDYPRDTLTRCAGTGSALILVHRTVFERIAEKFGPVWYERVANPSMGRLIGEDLSFCMRAGALDIPVHVHTGVKTTHHKPVWLAEGDYLRQRFLNSLASADDEAPLVAEYREGATREDRFTAPRDDCPHPERWHSSDPDSTEHEVTELVAAMITALQPDFVVETGTAFGQTARAIGRALQRNGQGRLVSLEVDPARVEAARTRCESLPVTVEQIPSLDYTPDQPIDFAWFDSLVDLRPQEFRRYLPHMHERTVVGFHDTGPQHRVRELLKPLEDEGLIVPLYLPTPRGVCFARVMTGG